MSISLAGAALAGQAGLGLAQTVGGALMKKPEIPEIEIPQEVFQNMSDAEYWSYVGMPETQRQRYLEDIQTSSANALSRVSDRKGGLGAVSSIQAREAESLRELATLDTKMRMDNLNKLYKAREVGAQYDLQTQQLNREKSLQERTEKKQIIGAGLQNVMGAFGTIGDVAAEDTSLTLKSLFK